VGALRGNAERMLDFARRAEAEGVAVLVFPEMTLSGYPPEDLVLKRHFLDDCLEEAGWLAERLPRGLVTLFGAPRRDSGVARNSACLCTEGRIAGWYDKMELPNYGVFDEKRLFEPGTRPGLFRMGDGPNACAVAVQICEDSWHLQAPAMRSLDGLKPSLCLNLSASPYHAGKLVEREKVLGAAAGAIGAPLAYCNLVGGQDELVFDGGSMLIAPDGKVLARARRFEEDLLVCDLEPRRTEPRTGAAWTLGAWTAPAEPRKTVDPRIEPALDPSEEVYAALVLGLRDYMDKNGFRKAVVGLSGGVDSALVATIAADALGADRVAGVTMPSRFSSSETRNDAEATARILGLEFHTLPIQKLFDTARAELAPVWGEQPAGLAQENLQARLRGLLLMALSNQFGWLVLSTGNKSELATGYCTLYGDMVGGFALLKDVLKTRVYELCRWRNARDGRPVIPQSVLDRPPTAELRENQKDSDSLPPYPILDAILERIVENNASYEDVVTRGFDPETVRRTIRLVDAAEYKRRQGAPGVKITPRAFGRDRRVPMTNRYRETP
jgi:NAD+ synthase (glutamine-hydrolysing)